jgi:hypothetical protein
MSTTLTCALRADSRRAVDVSTSCTPASAKHDKRHLQATAPGTSTSAHLRDPPAGVLHRPGQLHGLRLPLLQQLPLLATLRQSRVQRRLAGCELLLPSRIECFDAMPHEHCCKSCLEQRCACRGLNIDIHQLVSRFCLCHPTPPGSQRRTPAELPLPPLWPPLRPAWFAATSARRLPALFQAARRGLPAASALPPAAAPCQARAASAPPARQLPAAPAGPPRLQQPAPELPPAPAASARAAAALPSHPAARAATGLPGCSPRQAAAAAPGLPPAAAACRPAVRTRP